MIGLSTEMVVFNLVAQADYDKLDLNGLPPEMTQKVRTLPKFEHVSHRFQ
jgi:hypothetical protein